LELPTGSSSRGLGTGHLQAFLPVWVQKSWGPWTAYGGGDYWRNPGAGNKDYWLTGWLIQRDLSKSLTLGGEIYHTTPSVVDGESNTSHARVKHGKLTPCPGTGLVTGKESFTDAPSKANVHSCLG
jgi:hypothetical protein